jgi:hypothetical protein
VGLAGTVADATTSSVGAAVGTTVSVAGGGSALGSTGGVTVGPGANVAGCAGRGVLVGVGVGPDAAGEHALKASPANTSRETSAHNNRVLRGVFLCDIIISLQMVYRNASYAGLPMTPKAASSVPGWVTL